MQDYYAIYLMEEHGAAWETSYEESVLKIAAFNTQEDLVEAILARLLAKRTGPAALAAIVNEAAGRAVAKFSDAAACLKLLVKAGLDVRQWVVLRGPSHEGPSPLLHQACRLGDKDAMAFLLRKGCDPQERDAQGCMVHHVAAARGQHGCIRLLLRRCPTIDLEVEVDGGEGGTAICLAARVGHLHTVQVLIEARADPRKAWDGPHGPMVSSYLPHIASYLQEKVKERELAARARRQAAARAQEEAARAEEARRARNERRRQKQKEAKARRQRQQQDAAAMGANGSGQQDDEQSDDSDDGSDDEEEEAAAAPQPGGLERPPPLSEFLDAHVPPGLVCPISLQLLEDPVLLMGDGCTYSRAAIERHLAYRRERELSLTSPTSNLIMDPAQAVLAPNVAIRGFVLEFKERTTREWAAAEQRWQEESGQGQNGEVEEDGPM